MNLTVYPPLSFFQQLPQPIFVTGTDTEIGKTTCSCLLLNYFNQNGLSTLAAKPIASGCVETKEGWRNDDALQLQAASSVKIPYDAVNPFALPLAISPYLAAKATHQTIQINDVIEKSQLFLSTIADIKLMEGAGGWHHPLNDTQSFADLPCAFNASVILVVGIKLGCINHALLSAQAILASTCHFAGWIANELISNETYATQMIELIQMNLQVPLLARVGYGSLRTSKL